MNPKKLYIETFGCQMNVNDSERVAGLLAVDGYEAVAQAEEADLVFVNTCAVRERAADKLYHALGRLKGLKQRKPDLVVGVGGCVAQLEGTAVLDRAPHVDVLVGTHNVGRVGELVRQAREEGRPQVDLDRAADSFAVPAELVAHGNPVRAYVTVMEGCNHVCSFCVVPRTRGQEVNRDPESIVAEVASLAARGVPEVMLLGQTVNAYRFGDVDFAELLARVNAVPGLRRLRFTTSHPAHVDVRFARALADFDKLCPYLHLPVQSGADRILDSMRRGYTRSQYVEIVALLRDRVPHLALTSDVIVGYPGETEDDFQQTVDLVDEIGFEGLFIFAYSARPGTTALKLEDDVPESEKKRRVHALNSLQQRRQARCNAERVGEQVEVLVENIDSSGKRSGRSRDFKIVHFDGDAAIGELAVVDVTSAGSNSLVGRRVLQPVH